MAKINWSRHSYGSRMGSDYYANPKTGFDKAWHDDIKKQKRKAEKQKLAQARAKIKALRQSAHKVDGPDNNTIVEKPV